MYREGVGHDEHYAEIFAKYLPLIKRGMQLSVHLNKET